MGFLVPKLQAQPGQSLLSAPIGHRGSFDYRCQQNGFSCPGMLKDAHSKHVASQIAARHVTKGFDPQHTNIDSLDALEMDAIDHILKPIVFATLCPSLSAVMSALDTPSVAVEPWHEGFNEVHSKQSTHSSSKKLTSLMRKLET
jgi:hypothetical protein